MAGAIATVPAGEVRSKRRSGKSSAMANKMKERMKGIAARARAEAAEGRHTLAAVAAAGLLGYLEGKAIAPRGGAVPNSILSKVPALPKVGRAGTLGLGAWVGSRMVGGRAKEYLRHAATGFLSVAAFNMAVNAAKPENTAYVAGDDGEVAGDDGEDLSGEAVIDAE